MIEADIEMYEGVYRRFMELYSIEKINYLLKKNLNKFSNHKILICIKNNNLANIIKLQLNKIGIKGKNICHFNM